MKNRIDNGFCVASEPAMAIAKALPLLPGRWKRSRISAWGVKALLVTLSLLIGMPSPRVLACACTEVVGGSGAVKSNLTVDNEKATLKLEQSDINLPGIIPVELTRTYRSDYCGTSGPFGLGWAVNSLNYIQYEKQTFSGLEIKICFNGDFQTFSEGSGFANDRHTMSLSFTGQDEVTVFQRIGKVKWVFDYSTGALKEYIDKNGNKVEYTWKVIPLYGVTVSLTNWAQDTKQLNIYCPLTITYPGGRQLVFTYGTSPDESALCKQVTGPNGINISYSYTNKLLTGVSIGNGQALSYSYQIQYSDLPYAWLTKVAYTNAAEINTGYYWSQGKPTKAKVAYVTGPLNYNHVYFSRSSDDSSSLEKIDSLNRLEIYESQNLTSKFHNTLYMDALGRQTYKVVGDQDQVKSVQNTMGRTTWYDYDFDNSDYIAQLNLLKTTNFMGRIWTNTWDYYYNKTKTVDPLQHEVNYTYDSLGNLLTTKNGLGQTTVTNTYYSTGQLATTADGRGNTTRSYYDGNGFLTKTTDAAGKNWLKTYDEAGNVLSSTDPLGNTSSTTYTNVNKPATATDALGNTTNYVYDEMANLTSVTDANNNATSYGWDQFQRKTFVTDALNNSINFAYDAEANMTTLTDALGHSLSYTYDGVNNKKTFVFPDGKTESYDYSLTNNLTKKTDTAGSVVCEGDGGDLSKHIPKAMRKHAQERNMRQGKLLSNRGQAIMACALPSERFNTRARPIQCCPRATL